MKLRTLLAAALVAGSLGASRAQAQINVAFGGGPGNMAAIFTSTIAPSFEKATGKTVTLVAKRGQELTDAIKAGEVDVVFFDPAVLDSLVKSGDVTGATPVMTSKIGLAVKAGDRKPDISTPDKLKAALLAAKSVGHSRAASGQAFMAAVEKLGITPEVTAKQVIPQGGLVGQLAVDDKAEIAVQQVPELLGVPGVEIVGDLPGDLQKFLPLSAAVATKAKDAASAKAFITFLRSAPGKAMLKEKGFDVP